MRFRTRQKPRGLLSRRDHSRLTLLILALGLVIFSINVVRRPGFWSRLFPDESTEAAFPAATSVEENDSAMVHTVLRPDFAANGASEWPAETVPDDLLSTIEDNVIGVTAAEARAYLVTLRLAEKISSEAAEQLPLVRYALLMDSPAACRGKAWKIVGTLRRLTVEPLSDERFGVNRVVEGWLSLPDSGDRLVRVVACRRTRFLLRASSRRSSRHRWRCRATSSKEKPMPRKPADCELHRCCWPTGSQWCLSRNSAPRGSDQLTPWLGWLTILTCCGIGLVVVAFAVSDAGNRRQRTHELTQLPATSSFDGVEAVSPAESLRALEAAEASGSSVAAENTTDA